MDYAKWCSTVRTLHLGTRCDTPSGRKPAHAFGVGEGRGVLSSPYRAAGVEIIVSTVTTTRSYNSDHPHSP